MHHENMGAVLVISCVIYAIVLSCCGSSALPQLPAPGFNCSESCLESEPCFTGCSLWQSALNGSCESSCRELFGATEDGQSNSLVHCGHGCDYAVNRYVRHIEELIGNISHPEQISRMEPDWVVLEIENWPEEMPVGYFQYWEAQYRFEIEDRYENFPTELPDWKFFDPPVSTASLKRDGEGKATINITDLVPFQVYRFRIVWTPAKNTVLYGKESYRILMNGSLPGSKNEKPSSPPIVTRIEPLDHSKILLEWKRPFRRHNPMLSYTIYLQVKGLVDPRIKVVRGYMNSFIVDNLLPNTKYCLNMTAANRFGDGPYSPVVCMTTLKQEGANPWDLMYVTTEEILVYDNVQAKLGYLNYQADEKVMFPFSGQVKEYYDNRSSGWDFRSFAYDTHRNLAFVMNGTDELYLVDFNNKSTTMLLKDSKLNVISMGLDWLRHELYILSGDKILRCHVGGIINSTSCEEIAIVSRFVRKIIVDPLNGFLFWLERFTSSGGKWRSQVHRYPLFENRRLGDLRESTALISHPGNAPSFDVSFDTCRLYLPDLDHSFTNNGSLHHSPAVYSIGACGAEMFRRGQDIRSRRVPMINLFQHMENMVHTPDPYFYWYDKENLYYEQDLCHNPPCDTKTPRPWNMDSSKYKHLAIRFIPGKKVGMQMCNKEAQPIPYPYNAPDDIDIRLSHNSIFLAWSTPQPLEYQYKTAWKKWNYTVEVEGLGKWNTSGLSFWLPDLNPDSNYTVKIRAESSSKVGPWTEDIVVRTFAKTVVSPTVILARGTSLVKFTMSNPVGEQVAQIGQVDALFWAPDFIGALVNDTLRFLPTVANFETDHWVLPIRSAVSVDYDWIGRKLYWTDGERILRSTINGRNEEVIVEKASGHVKQVAVDSLRGTVYWVTSHSVGAAKLNGEDKKNVFETDLWAQSREEVSRVVIDFHLKRIHAVVEKDEGLDVYEASLMEPTSFEMIGKLPKTREGVTKSAAVFERRIVTISKEKRLLMRDLKMNNSNVLMETNVTAFTLVPQLEDELRELNRTFFDFSVVPAAVEMMSIVVEDDDEGRKVVRWTAADNCNYGEVLYEVTVDDPIGRVILNEVVNGTSVTLHQEIPSSSLRVQVRPFTVWASGPMTRRFIEKDTVGLSVLMYVLIGFLAWALFTCIGVVWMYKSRVEKRISRRPTPNGPEHERDLEVASPLSENAVYDLIAQIPRLERCRIQIEEEVIGSGNFGEVYKGQTDQLNGAVEMVAIKKLHNRQGCSEARSELLREAQLMSQINHNNILRFHGVCTDSEPLLIVMEYMNQGDLKKYLYFNSPAMAGDYALTYVDQLEIARDVAEGCMYLQEHKFVHRDLAARNCLVTHTDRGQRVVKIADFGLARDIYSRQYYRRGAKSGPLPVRWMAPESLKNNVTTTESDVWSFGVVVWEVMTYGQTPWLRFTNDEVVDHLKMGKNMIETDSDARTGIRSEMLSLMLDCWKVNPKERPKVRSCLGTIDIVLRSYRQAMERPETYIETDCSTQKYRLSSSYPMSPKSESCPTLTRIDRHHFMFRSSPDARSPDRNSFESGDSGFAYTPRASKQPEPVELSVDHDRPAVLSEVTRGERVAVNAEIQPTGEMRSSPYLQVLYSSSEGSNNSASRLNVANGGGAVNTPRETGTNRRRQYVNFQRMAVTLDPNYEAPMLL